MLQPLVRRLARSRRLAGRLLGLELPTPQPGEHYLDASTLALLAASRRHVARGSRVLDIGTGSFAVVALWLSRRLGCEVVATELDPRVAQRARESVRLNAASLRVVEGELFAGLAGPFDSVLFNPPYVPTAVGRARALPERWRTQWDGGADGTATIARFLAAFAREGRDAQALLAVNRLHVPRARVLERIDECPELELTAIAGRPWLPSEVYVLVTRKGPNASASSPDA